MARDGIAVGSMEERDMRRVAMVLATVGLIAVGMATTPARAHDGWWGYPEWREHAWREREWREREWRRHWWREHHYRQPGNYGYSYYTPPTYYQPGVTYGYDFR
jgi:hypothetical protein